MLQMGKDFGMVCPNVHHARTTYARTQTHVCVPCLTQQSSCNQLPVHLLKPRYRRSQLRGAQQHAWDEGSLLPARAHFLLLKHTHSQMYTHRHTHTNTRTHAHTQTHTRIHACARTHTCTHSLTHTLTSPFTHTLPEKNYSGRHQELHNFVGALNCQIVATNEPYFEMIFLQKGHDDIGSIPMIAFPLCFGC